MKLTIKAKELRSIGYPDSPVVSIAMNVIKKHYKHESKEVVMNLLKRVLESPVEYKNDAVLAIIAQQLIREESAPVQEMSLNKEGIQFSVFGGDHIEASALHQMYQAARLPVSVAGALMPDAHSGYGLPIGGVLATRNAVIPYGVGMDIGCRMCLSIFDIHPSDLQRKEFFFTRTLDNATLFGSGARFDRPVDHDIMDYPLFYQIPLLKSLHSKAWKQLGSSGSGNHFAEFGIIDIKQRDEVLGIDPGTYVGLLTHSGSRGLGAGIAQHYTNVAISKRRLPGDARSLSWLCLDEAEGVEYWEAMNLAGDYAAACHHVIHAKIAKEIGRTPLTMVENHHNFAWKEQFDGQEVIVHRKGATPAGKDVLGIIPGSMTATGFIVKGKGESAAVNSASHGAGRRMSRAQAAHSITQSAMLKELQAHGVTLIGGGPDEAPSAYKDIHAVMRSQKSLVDILGLFTPKIVKMAG